MTKTAIAATRNLTPVSGRRYSDPAKVPGGGSFAANRPGGLTNIVDRQWNPTDGAISGGVLPPASLTGTDSTGMQWFQGSSISPIIATAASLTTTIGQTIAALPDANATCMAIKYPSGFSAGDTPFGIYANSVPANLKKMYMSCWIFQPVGFNSNGNNIKWVFFAQNGSNSRNHVWMLNSGANGSYIGPWLATQGGGGSFNVGGAANTKTGALTRLAGPPSDADGYWDYREGAWHCIEWFAQRETTNGVTADGIFQCWFDGTLINSFNNLNYNAVSGDPVGFDTVSFTPYYGGGGSAAPSDQYLLLGRFLVAGST